MHFGDGVQTSAGYMYLMSESGHYKHILKFLFKGIKQAKSEEELQETTC